MLSILPDCGVEWQQSRRKPFRTKTLSTSFVWDYYRGWVPFEDSYFFLPLFKSQRELAMFEPLFKTSNSRKLTER
jgi:hypothetical protein